jgi:hypothetical protein
LPFDNLGGDEQASRLADGMTEDVITNLARFKDLLVIARNSTLAYKGKPRQESMPEATPAAVVTLPSLTTRAFPKCSRQPKEADPCRPSRSPDERGEPDEPA